ncbi:glycosyltransferase family 61 protein [Natrialbaceae archaeon GCM10025810]|uniref:glycosyltransferase family 61 protein n=1 Tax=Halovalidus salilacus TaxID=3075124 RepID=UPI0036141BA5
MGYLRSIRTLQRGRPLDTIKDAPSFFISSILERATWPTMRDRAFTRDELREYVSSTGQIWEYGPKFDVEFPDSFPFSIGPFRNETGTRRIDPPFVCDLPDSQLVGPNPIAITSDGNPVIESTRGNVRNLRNAHRELPIKFHLRLLTDGNLASTNGDHADCVLPLWMPHTRYYHWLLEYLPKLQAVDVYTEQTGRKPTLLLRENPPGWMSRSMEVLGFDSYRKWSGGTLNVDHLVIPTHRLKSARYDYNPSHVEYEWLRDRALESIDDVQSNRFSSRVYISREDADRRRVANEPEVMDLLEKRGFEAYKLTDLDFTDQIRLFNQADVIAGPHGGGFANLVFSRQAKVVEFLPTSHPAPYFFYLSHELGLKYTRLNCDPIGDNRSPKHWNMKVDIDRLESVLDRTLN